MEQLDEFVDNLLKEKGITGLDPEVEKTLKEEMRTRLNEQINRSAIEQLSEDKAAELTIADEITADKIFPRLLVSHEDAYPNHDRHEEKQRQEQNQRAERNETTFHRPRLPSQCP